MKPTLNINITVEKDKETAILEIIPSNSTESICYCELSDRKEAEELVSDMQRLNEQNNYSFLRTEADEHYFELRENQVRVIFRSRKYSSWRNVLNGRDFFMRTLPKAETTILTIEKVKH